MDASRIERYGEELYRALREARAVPPLTEREPDLTIDDAYRIQLDLVSRRRRLDGERVVGKKIGVTSEAVQNALNVRQPDFGHLLSSMTYRDGSDIPVDGLIAPRAEGEIAFLLKTDLRGPGITETDVLDATERVVACFEIVDSRIRDWKIRIEDTIADNASSGVFLLGSGGASPRDVDLVGCRMTLEKNGEQVGEGTGAATLGSPLRAMVWLANTLGALGLPLNADEVILSGSLGPLVPVTKGDRMRVTIEGIGEASVRFT